MALTIGWFRPPWLLPSCSTSSSRSLSDLHRQTDSFNLTPGSRGVTTLGLTVARTVAP